MGFLFASKSLTWEESLEYLKYVRDHGIEQFLHTFHSVRSVHGDLLRWGDEIEYGVVRIVGDSTDPDRHVQASLRSHDMIDDLQRIEAHGQVHGLSESDKFTWMPEYGAWMLESTPGKPYEGILSLLEVEYNMMMRRSRLLSVLQPDEIVPTMSCFPMLGVGVDSTYPPFHPNGPVAESLFIPDEVIFPHPRFPTLSANIRKRRGEKVFISLPKYRDSKTEIDESLLDSRVHPKTVEEADKLPFVYADAMAFGMGCCSLQTTFQAKDLAESRHLYDHLAALTPVMLALSAATPILRGWLTDTDSRWSIVAQSVDDRTAPERGSLGEDRRLPNSKMAGNGVRPLTKSRFGAIDCYMCNCKNGANEQSRAAVYNDVPLVYDEAHYERLVSSGVDPILAQHVAHLFARDPLVIFNDRIELDDRAASDHWESLQSTNWQTVRWKPPPALKGLMDTRSENHIGWRVEFRSMEIQITDFENAAYVVFIVLLSRVILGLELNLYIPISKLDENMDRAETRDAVLGEKFWFRTSLLPAEVKAGVGCCNGGDKAATPGPWELMTVHEILMGKGDYYPGLIPLCRTYLDFIGCDSVTHAKVDTYLGFLADRASGKIKTGAAWIRDFVLNHPEYKQDSRVPHSVAYDLLMRCKHVGEGSVHEPTLTGENKIPKINPGINPFQFVKNEHTIELDAISAAKAACWETTHCRKKLLKTYLDRALARKAADAQTELDKKLSEMDSLRKEISELMTNLNIMRTTSENINITTPPGSGRSANGN
jgi:glutamate--cysteine ligase catalytic subunit